MSLVEVDERGRVTIPKEMRTDAEKVLIIPLGESYMIVPIPKAPAEHRMKVSGKEAKKVAEGRLAAEVKGRARRSG
jgi:virulence-associated protein VagC